MNLYYFDKIEISQIEGVLFNVVGRIRCSTAQSTEVSSVPRTLYCTQLMVQSRVSVLAYVQEDKSQVLRLGSNPRPLKPRSVTLPTLPRAG